jgi:hypothetical protein
MPQLRFRKRDLELLLECNHDLEHAKRIAPEISDEVVFVANPPEIDIDDLRDNPSDSGGSSSFPGTWQMSSSTFGDDTSLGT